MIRDTGQDFQMVAMSGSGVSPNPNLLVYLKSIAGHADRQTAVSKLTDQLANIGWIMAPKWRVVCVSVGMITNKGHETAWTTNQQLLFLAKRYNIPLALYNPGNIHWTMMVNMPQKEATGWKVAIYNPMNPGEKEIVIPDKHMTESHILVYCPGEVIPQVPIHTPQADGDFIIESAAPGTLTGGSVLDQLDRLNRLTDGYDLRIPRFTGELEGLTIAKTAPLQTSEGFNCGLWCIEHAAVAWGIKPGSNTFKKNGLRQL